MGAAVFAVALLLPGCTGGDGTTGPTVTVTETVTETETVTVTRPPPQPEVESVRVPSLVGLSLADAKDLLRSRGLRVDPYQRDSVVGILLPLAGPLGTADPPSDEVIRQAIDPGTRVRVGRLIRLVLAAPEPAGGCDPSYPNVCMAPPPPYLNCDDVPYNNITVVGSDPHGFDGEGDGVGCET